MAFAATATATAQTTTTGAPPTTTSPSASTTTTTTPKTAPTTTTTNPAPLGPTRAGPTDEVAAPTTAEDAAARSAFAALTTGQRQLLTRLQSARDDLASARARVLTLAADVDAAQTRVDAADTAVRVEDAVVDDLGRTLERLHGEAGVLATAMYQSLGNAVAFSAVNTAAHGELSRARTYAKAPRDALDSMVSLVVTTKRQLSAARDTLGQVRDAADAALSRASSALTQQGAAVAAAESASATAADAVTAALGSGVGLLAQIADPQFGADFITQALAVVQGGDDDPVTVVGAFRVPVPGAPLGSPYGKRIDPLTGGLDFHPGIDFEAPAGAEVHAAAPGTVVIAGDCGGYGNCVVIAHGRSLATVSAHLQQVLVTVGQPVADGQVVGLVGSTGKSTGPHLHFEVRLHGVPIDPMATLTT